MLTTSWEIVTSHLCELGEGPVWDEQQNRILWLDIPAGAIHSFYPATGRHTSLTTGQYTGAVVLKPNGNLVAALQNGFYEIDETSGTLTFLADPEAHLPENRFNDGKCDPQGRFWAGTMHRPETQVSGHLYTLDTGNNVTWKAGPVGCSNGLAWSADSRTLYYIDSPTRTVVAYDFDPGTGAISGKRVVITIPEGEGFPDGMTIDAEGALWIALWDGWKLVRYEPAGGTKTGEIQLPAARVTSCTFGGDDFEDLYITTAKINLSEEELREQPLAGSLFVIRKVGPKGLPAVRFGG